MMFAPIPADARATSSAGMLRALGVTSAKRSSLLPDVPTIAEAGLPGFEASQRYGACWRRPARRAPSSSGSTRSSTRVLATDEVRKRLALEGAEPIPGTPEDYAADIDREETRVVEARQARSALKGGMKEWQRCANGITIAGGSRGADRSGARRRRQRRRAIRTDRSRWSSRCRRAAPTTSWRARSPTG